MMIEYPDIDERRQALSRLIGIEDRVWVQVEGCPKVYAMADEDLERENEQKTSSVHFLRFELDPSMKKALTCGANIRMGVDHPNYQATIDPLAGSGPRVPAEGPGVSRRRAGARHDDLDNPDAAR